MKAIIYIFAIILFTVVGCNHSSSKSDIQNAEKEKTQDVITKKESNSPHSELKFDSLLRCRTSAIDYFYSMNNVDDTIDFFCNCEKDVKNNRIFIQLSKDFPAQSELLKGDYNGKGIMFEPDYPIQATYITLAIKDSVLESAEICRMSQEPQFDGKYKITKPLKRYNITLTKSIYKIAHDIRGEFEFILPFDFGIFSNDTIIRGFFHCNNSQILRLHKKKPYPKKQICKINKNLTFQKRAKYESDEIFDESNIWECDCKMNIAKDTLTVTNMRGDGESGDALTIHLNKKLKVNFLYETWTDCCTDYYLQYSFSKYLLELNKNPFQNGYHNLIGTYWIASDTIPKLFGERLIKKGIFRCK